MWAIYEIFKVCHKNADFFLSIFFPFSRVFCVFFYFHLYFSNHFEISSDLNNVFLCFHAVIYHKKNYACHNLPGHDYSHFSEPCHSPEFVVSNSATTVYFVGGIVRLDKKHDVLN